MRIHGDPQPCLNLTPFASHLSFIFMCGSGSTKRLNTDPDQQHYLRTSKPPPLRTEYPVTLRPLGQFLPCNFPKSLPDLVFFLTKPPEKKNPAHASESMFRI